MSKRDDGGLKWKYTEPVEHELLLVQFKPDYWQKWTMAYWGSGMLWGEDEGQYKGMGSEATNNILRWVPLDDAISFLLAEDKEATT